MRHEQGESQKEVIIVARNLSAVFEAVQKTNGGVFVGNIYVGELKDTTGPLGRIGADKIYRLAKRRPTSNDYVMIGFIAEKGSKQFLYLNTYGYMYVNDTNEVPKPNKVGKRLGSKTLQVGKGVFHLYEARE